MSSAVSNIHIRTVSPNDAAALLAIYAPYVQETAITFEYEVPSTEEFARRITHTLEKYPYLVTEKAHTILGYAYAGPFHERAAYDWAVETSIYVDQNLKHSGIGAGKCIKKTRHSQYECMYCLHTNRRPSPQ